MKTGSYSSLMDFAAEIERRSKAKKDFIANTKSVALVPTGFAHQGVQMRIGNDQQFQVNNTGHAQIAEVTDIPRKYYDRMLAEQPALLADNVNAWFKQDAKPQLFRTLDGKVRAVRSDKFRTDLEYEDMASAVLPTLLDMDVAIMSYSLTETRMYVKVVDKRVEREVTARGGKFGDGKHTIVRCLSPAITISNSEVGYGSASVLGGVYDGFCTNLASFGERSVRKYHVGAKHELTAGTDYALLSDETKRKTSEATIAQITDVVRAAFERAKFDSLVDKIEATTEQRIESDDVVKVVAMAGRTLGLNETEGKSVLRSLIEGGDLTRFGLYNAVTATSQDVEDYDRATELERVGASIIDLPAKDWRVISQAA